MRTKRAELHLRQIVAANIEMQRAAERDVEDLHALADAKDRQAALNGGMDSGKVFVLTGLERVRFKRPVEPGDQLRLELSCLKRRGSFWKMQGVATVDGKVVAQAEISAMEIDML